MTVRATCYRTVAAAAAIAAAVGFGAAMAGTLPGGYHSHAMLKPPPGSTSASTSGTGHFRADPPPSGDSGDSGGHVLAAPPPSTDGTGGAGGSE